MQLDLKQTIGQILSVLYPVGCYLWTSKTPEEFHPNTAIGGSWELIDPGIFIVSAGSGYPVNNNSRSKDGGVPTVTLNTSQTPIRNHKHGFTNPTIPNHKHSMKWLWSGGAGGNLNAYTLKTDRSQMERHTESDGGGGRCSGGDVGYTEDTSAAAHENRPPYKCAYCWHRIG